MDESVGTAHQHAGEFSQQCLQHFDVNWLLSRAAHGLREAMDTEAMAHGTSIRGQIVLTALVQNSHPDARPYSQLALGHALGVDKTTMTALLDKLERQGLVVRTPDPNDRRARIPVPTEAGRELQAKLYHQLAAVEDRVLADLAPAERDVLRSLLRRIISTEEPVEGSCV
ncbi:MarR family winged helix-turn-helix transcriptional regulator [Kibdelosporangium phytohabitans]|uniref:MarR family winged helix-turn-helix transcriptional regulator n=1 Tax=Kibdelosporangium phytohabitans TaxID=860235 RepID=UPI000B1E3FFD|nr:MarR family transcriptional regulator [Kibdelosporangium phytohabitans]MBE1471833.1 DNA-binding MarR family transcriptional regulator [Kibdelosporangium phytohabitans]